MWLRSVIGAVRRFFGGKNTVKPSTSDPGPPPTASPPDIPPAPPIMPPDVKPKMIVYTKTEVAALERLSFNAFTLLASPLGKLIESGAGIFWLIPVIQAAHESRSGNSLLARNHLNLFGIKPSSDWRMAGKPIVYMSTIEHINGKDREVKAGFRAYQSWLESFMDWAELMQKPAYAASLPLMRQGESKIEEAFIIMGRVYATDPEYGRKLVRIYRSIKGG